MSFYTVPWLPWPMPDSANYGWTCPKCGRVYSPSTPQCWSCLVNPPKPTNIDTTPIITVYGTDTQEPKP